MMNIYIPTRGREDKQKAIYALPPEIQKIAYLMCDSDRLDLLRSHNPDVNIEDIGLSKNIAQKRRAVLQHAGGQKFLMFDDKTTFKKRIDGKLIKMETVEDWNKMMAEVEEKLDEYPWVGISPQAGNNRVEEYGKEIARSYTAFGINPKLLGDIRFDGLYNKYDVPLYEDFYVLLKMFTTGLKNFVIFDYAFEHKHGGQGGNSIVRNYETQLKSVQALIKEFPQFVTLTEKEGWETMPVRPEPKIAWKQAFESYNPTAQTLDSFF